jgi:nucleobase:cation symporter-1, NCS1 family
VAGETARGGTPETQQTQRRHEHEVEGEFTNLPLLARERIWGSFDFASVMTGLGIATWAFIVGGATALYVDAKAGIAAIIIGNLVSCALATLAACIPCAKYGMEQATLFRSVFGVNGARVVFLVAVGLVWLGWNCVLGLMFSRSTANVSNAIAGTDIGPNSLTVTVLGLAGFLIAWLVVAKGPVSIKWFNKIVAPGLAVLTVLLLVLILVQRPWSEVAAAEPIAPIGDQLTGYMLGIELGLATGFGWWGVIGNLARLAKTQRSAFYGSMAGLFLFAVPAYIAGLLSALALENADPTTWMVPVAGPALGVLALLFVAFANVTSITSTVYTTCLALRLTGGRVFQRMGWWSITGLFLIGPCIAAFFPAFVFDSIASLLAWSAVAFAPLVGIHLVDFYILRRRRLDIRAFYDYSPGSPYAFWRGWNLAAIIALVLGGATYFALLNPSTFEHASTFKFVSASMPAFVVAGTTHYLLTKLFVQRTGRGGYELAHADGTKPVSHTPRGSGR